MAEELLVSVVGDASKLKGALDNASGHVANFSQKLSKVGKIATVGGAAITAAFTKTFLDFTKYETKLIDMAKVTSEPFDQIEAKLKTIDPMIGSSTELMEGYYQVISAGVKDPVRALETLTVAAEAGKAAHVAQSEVVKGITKMMAGYEGAIRDASEVGDLLFAIEKEGQTTVAELIPVIGGLAKISFDLNIEQTAMAASMAVISKTAGTTAEATTQYQAVLTGLMKPTEDMTLAMDDMGYASAELAIEEEGLVEVLKHLEEYSGRTGVSMAKLFGRKEAMLGFSALGAEGFRVLDETIVSVGKGAGGAEKAFLEWSKSGAAAIDKIKNTFLNFSIMIGEKVAPMIKNILEKVTDIITKVIEWADENEELTEKLFTWGLALGAALTVLGPILIILPGIITALGLLKVAFIPFLVGGAIIYGLKKLSEYLGDIKKRAHEAYTEFKDWPLDVLNVKIAELKGTIAGLEAELEEAEKGFSLFGIELKKQDPNIGRLEQVIKDLKIELGLYEEQRDEATGTEKEAIDVSEDKITVDKLIAEGQETVNKLLDEWNEKVKLYAQYTDTATESGAEFLDGMYRWTQVAKEWGQVSLYFLRGSEYFGKLSKETDKVTASQETMAKATGKVYDKWYELAKLWAVRPDLRAYFLGTTQALEELEEEVGDTSETFASFETIAKDAILKVTGYIVDNLSPAIENLLFGMEDFEWEWEDFWSGLWSVLKKYIANMITKLLIAIPLMLIWNWLTGGLSAITFWEMWDWLGFEKGGEVKGYQAGGAADTIPARLTVGEYVIAKPMTDFIRQFKAIPGNLVDAISAGLPTPAPVAFAGGGLVGSPSVSASNVGGVTIYVDIHDNRVSDEVDIRKLSVAVSDEIVRKLNQRRRF